MLYFKLIVNGKAANLIKILIWVKFFLNFFLNKTNKGIHKILLYIFLEKGDKDFLKYVTDYSERIKNQFQSSQNGKNFYI